MLDFCMNLIAPTLITWSQPSWCWDIMGFGTGKIIDLLRRVGKNLLKDRNTQSEDLIRIFIDEAFNKGNLSILEQVIHPEYQYWSPNS